jgi:protein TonB
VTGLPSPATLLASLTIHGVALSSLFLLATGEPVPSAFVIDLSELEVARGDDRATKNLPGPERPIARAPVAAKQAPSGPVSPSPPPPSPAPSADAAPPTPAAPPSPALASPERELALPKPDQPEPARSPVTAIEETRDAAAPSSTPSAPSEPRSTGGAAGRTDVVADGPATPQTPTAGSSAGGAGAVVALAPPGPAGLAGEPGAEYGAYLAGIRRRIQESLEYPQAARRRGLKGTVQLEILIKADGAISSVSVAGSSSYPLLDDAALEAVRSLGRQPFPAGLLPRPLRVRLPVVFDLK